MCWNMPNHWMHYSGIDTFHNNDLTTITDKYRKMGVIK